MADLTTRPAQAFTYHDLADMPADGYRREVVGGALIVTPAPSAGHQRASDTLLTILRGAETTDLMVLSAPCDWHLRSGDSVQPDLLVIERTAFQPDGPVSAVPLLVVEVLPPSNADQDRLIKRALYESLGVPAYWIVDPREPSLVALRLVKGRYEVEAAVTGSDHFTTDWPFHIHVIPADLGR